MTVRKVIELADSVKPNDMVDDVKIGWIGQIEGMVLCEILGKHPEKVVLPQWDEDELAIPEAYSRIYLLHVIAMMELVAGNSEIYSQLCIERDAMLKSYAKYVLRSR